MQSEIKKRLEEKKEDLRNRLQVRDACILLEKYWLPAYVFLLQAGTSVSLKYLVCARETEKEIWLSEIQKEPWVHWKIRSEHIRTGNDFSVHEQLYTHYPGVLPLRYLPDLKTYLPVAGATHGEILTALKMLLQLDNPMVWVFYTRFTPVMSIPFQELIDTGNSEWMLPLEDICILAEDSSWLIFRSMEDEWRYGLQ